MKKLTVVVFVVVLGFSQLFASNNLPINPEQQLRNQITTLLDRPEIEMEEALLSANIKFALNGKGEIVVLTVDTKQEVVANFVKSRLNYKKVATAIKARNKIFKIILTIKKPQNS